MPPRARRGFNLLELVVVLFVIALVVALVLPAINGRRTPAHRTQCLNNMRNIGIAIQNFASQNGGELPALHGDDGDPLTTSDRYQTWPRQLLRTLDQSPYEREIAVVEHSDPSLPAGTLDPRYIQVFTCPQDADSFQTPGGLSYVINAGYGFFPVDRSGAVTEQGTHSVAQDWDGDGEISEQDRLITRATGVSWRPDKVIPRLTLDDIAVGDGTGNTLFLTENLHAGPWTSSDTRALGFVIDRDRLTFNTAAGPLALTAADLGPFAINAAKNSKGPVPAPSSNHGDSVNVIWADGHGTAISEAIDPLVYARVLTSQGASYGEPSVDDAASGF
jgi:prepilin-type N-terminal cleavage/methylation domain-containing protein/prepilin-type processing-associated H-X9-DG protein